MTKLTRLCNVGFALWIAICPLTGQEAELSARTSANRPAITANIEFTFASVTANGTSLRRTTSAALLRDEFGRTSVQQGTKVMIADPVRAVSITLDSGLKKASILRIPQPVGTPLRVQPAVSNQPVRRYLGAKDIDGFRRTGEEVVQITPAGSPLGNDRPLERVTQTWTANEISLPILIVVTDPLAGTITTKYTNIKVGATIDPSSFVVPPEYQVVERSPTK
jgi:hypothetical protein